MTTHTVPVALGSRSYEILIHTDAGERLASTLASWLAERGGPTSHLVVVTDEHLQSAFDTELADPLAEGDWEVDVLVIEPGEPAKTLETCQALWETMLEVGTDRRSAVVAFGGGVVGDVAGFAAASYARGLRFVQIPTTLLAMVDSSVGGKTGVNLPGGKNMVGAFWQPAGVWIDTGLLESLPDRDYRAGLAEVIKYGVILDEPFFARLEQLAPRLLDRDDDALREVIARSCELKALVVSQDETETSGLRAVLNYGHTFAHAFETLTGYDELRHGEAVAMGMDCAARLAVALRRIDPELVERQRRLIAACGLPFESPRLDPAEVLDVMAHDKKVEHGRLRFVLPSRLGHVELVGDVPAETVREVLSTR